MPQPKTAQKKPAGKKVQREDDLRWWCPHCDHSNTLLTDTCGGCGGERSGDTVKP